MHLIRQSHFTKLVSAASSLPLSVFHLCFIRGLFSALGCGSRLRRISSAFSRGPFFCLLVAIFPSYRATAADDFLGHSFEQWSEMLSSSQQTERAYAAWALGQIATDWAGSPHDQIYFAELVKLVHDNDPTVRYWGILGLAGYANT